MKKLLSAILTLTLLLALSVPALAAPMEETDAWSAYEISDEAKAWICAHPEETASFLSDLDGYVAEQWSWYGSVAEMAEDWGESEEYVRAVLTEDWALTQIAQEERDAWKAEYEAAHPGALAALEANAYDYFARTYTWYDSPEEYRTSWGMTEEEFIAEMVELQILDLQAQEENRKELEQAKAGLGGVPGQIGVMLNGAYIAFPDAAPEAVNGRVMVPYRALMEALGGDVDYDETTRTVSCILAGTTLTLTLGENTLTIDENGEASILEMDCAAYAKDDRTYVPVRFISQAFGYDVLWDPGFETAVLLDRRGITEEIDAQFTVLNRALSVLIPDGSQPGQSDGTITTDLTLFDSIHGDQTYRLSADFSGLNQGISGQGSMTMDLSALGELIDLDALLEESDWYSGDEQARLRTLFGSLGSLSFEYIVNAGENALYFRSNILDILDEELAGAWLSWYGAGDVGMAALENGTIGGLLYETALSGIQTGGDPYGAYCDNSTPVLAYSGLTDRANQWAAVLGDECFTRTGQGDMLTLDAESLGLEDSDDNPFSRMELTFTVADSGAVTGAFAVQASGGSLFGLPRWLDGTVFVFSGEFSFGRSERSLALDFHWKNFFRLELEAAGEIAPASSAPLTAPPEGDKVIGADEAL